MACVFNYVEKALRETNPEEADRLNEKGIETWKAIKNSNLFTLNKKNEYNFSKEGTKQRVRQDDFINSINNNNFIFNKNNEVHVNLLKLSSKSNNVLFQKNQIVSNEGIIASEKTIRDLAARIADRIGIPVKFESDRSKEYKGKIENNVAYVNLAYATLDTPIHEILGHPIIRAIKDRSKNQEDSSFNKLYENLLEELSTTQKGEEVLDRIKRDYIHKEFFAPEYENNQHGLSLSDYISRLIDQGYGTESIIKLVKDEYPGADKEFMHFRYVDFEPEFPGDEGPVSQTTLEKVYNALDKNSTAKIAYSLEEQQEEAIVELLGLMTAEKLDNVKDGKLISLLKRLLKEMKQFIRSLINQKEIEIDKLPDNMTINDLSDLLAYSNSKLILPGYEVEYTTPDNEKFKTYQEASNHISELAKNSKDIDLSNISAKTDVQKILDSGKYSSFKKIDNKWFELSKNQEVSENIVIEEILNEFEHTYKIDNLDSFINKNKDYEKSKEIIEEWKKVNNIQYNPEEIYSRGQEFSSVVGAYSSFDVNLMMQNLLQHIEDNEKAGGKFAISAYTKPIDKQIGHLEGGGGKIKFKLYPQSNDILWAANTDVYSGSVWDASEKVNKDKKSELLGVSYTKYPSLRSINSVQPNLADIVDSLSHHHNELGITLTGNNFRLEYDEDIPYQTKKIINSINSILDQKYGKLVKPEIKNGKKEKVFSVIKADQNTDEVLSSKDFKTENDAWDYYYNQLSIHNNFIKNRNDIPFPLTVKIYDKQIGIQPIQTKENTSSITDTRLDLKKSQDYDLKYFVNSTNDDIQSDVFNTEEEAKVLLKEWKSKDLSGDSKFEIETTKVYKEKERTEQALINTKIAALKETAKKQPRSLIRSEVKPINVFNTSSYEQFNELDDLPFQKIPSKEKTDLSEFVDENKDTFLTSRPDNQSNIDVLFGDDNKITVNEVLSNIIENVSDLTNESKELIISAKSLLNKSGTKIKYVDENLLKNKDTVMQYNPSSNTIEVSKDRLLNYKDKTVVIAFLHEMTHGQIVQVFAKDVSKRTFAERDLVNHVEKFFNKYKDGKLSSEYGFKNTDEFVSELFANPMFRELVKNESKKWYTDFIAMIRRFFGLVKNSEYDKLLNKVVEFVSGQDTTDFKGIEAYDGVFETRVTKDSKYTSIDDKLNNALEKSSKNIENAKKRVKNSDSNVETKAKLIQEYSEVLKNIENHKFFQKWKGILTYVKAFEKSVNSVSNVVDEILSSGRMYDDDIPKILLQQQNYLAHFDLLPQIKELISNADINQAQLSDEDRTDYLDLKHFIEGKEGVIEGVLSKYDKIQTSFKIISQAGVIKISSDPLFNTKVETDQRNILREEYNALTLEEKSKISRDEYISEMMSNRDFNDFQDDLVASATSLVHDPSKDISSSSRLLDDSLNINSGLIQVVNNILAKAFDVVKEAVIINVRKMDVNYNKLLLDKKSKKPSEINKNIIERDSNGNVFLKGKYSVKFLDELKKIKDSLREKRDDNVKKMAVQDKNLESLKSGKKTISLRSTGDHNIQQGDQLHVTVNGAKTGTIVSIDRVQTFDNFKSLSDARKDDFARAVGDYVNYADFLKSNRYVNESSGMSKVYEEVYNFINGNQSMDIISYSKVEENEKEYEYFLKKNNAYKTWLKENTVYDRKLKTYRPSDKYLNKDKLTSAEKTVLDSYLKINLDNDKIEGFSSLILKVQGAEFHKIPSVNKSDIERRIESDLKGLTSNKIKDLLTVRAEDIGYESKSDKGDVVKNVKTHYRGYVDPNNQSLNLETMMRDEHWNGENYKSKSELAPKLSMFENIILTKEYYSKENGKSNYKGENSQELKKLRGIIERGVYDIVSHDAGKILGKYDKNKIVSSINGYAATLGMTFNLSQGVVNGAGGLIGLFMEAQGGFRFNKSNLTKACERYTLALPSLMSDVTNPVKQSYFNQLLEMFDVFGGMGQNEQDALRNSIMSKLGSLKMGNFMNESGEHMMHSILTESIISGIKVMNSDHRYIDKKGNVTTEANAASMSDMLYMDENGMLKMSDKVSFTSQNLKTDYHKGGKSHLNSLVKVKVLQLFGAYDIKIKNELSKEYYGKLVMMYKNFFLPMLAARFNGFSTVHKRSSDLLSDDKFYSSAEKEYIEGTYTSLGRMIAPSINTFFSKGVMPALDELKLMFVNYNNLSEYEKSNIRKAATEIILSSIILPSIGLMLAASGGDDKDKKNNALWFAMYVNRRLTQELAQFRNPMEMGRMLQNPIAGARVIQNAGNFIYDILTPFNFGTLKSGQSTFGYFDEDKKHRNKMIKDAGKLMPGISQWGIDYHQRYGLQFGN